MTTIPEEPAVEPDQHGQPTEPGVDPDGEPQTGEPDESTATQSNDFEPFAPDDPETV